MAPPLSVYIHIPFCARKCPYCDFNTYAVAKIPEHEYCSALIKELSFYFTEERFKGRSVQSIFFGGGTPSIFSAASIKRLIEAIRLVTSLSSDCEISLEANPGECTADRLNELSSAGVSRVSFGAQSASGKSLTLLGRTHTWSDVEGAVAAARQAGIKSVNVDFMFGLPGQSIQDVDNEIRHFLNLDVEHISTYGLTIERGTPLFQHVARKIIKPIDDENAAEMMERIIDGLTSAGYSQYEISNFSKSGFECRHNIAYWIGDDYIGVGAGAHSYYCSRNGEERTAAERWSNSAKPDDYMQKIQSKGESKAWREELELRGLIFEFFFLGLRRMIGISLVDFERYFGADERRKVMPALESLIERQLLGTKDGNICLTRRGLLVADSVFELLAEEIEPGGA